jgi:hypothetical protein
MRALNRRGFFGAGVGAIAATQVQSAGDPNVARGYRWHGVGVPANAPEAIPIEQWAPAEIKSLKDELAHVVGNREMLLNGSEHYDHAAIDSMRSLSPVARARMHAEMNDRISRRHEARRIQDRIDDLVERLGPLAKVLL